MLKDIRFWIILFFIIRMYGITNPPLEIAHNWRQSTGDMVARNFYEINNNILYPRLDMVGEKDGIIGTEFSVLNYLMYLSALVVGFHDWVGRLIVLIVSSFGVLYFYKLIKLKFDEHLAFVAAMLLLSSMWLTYSRKVMPDTFSVSLVIIGLYYVFSFLNTGVKSRLVAYLFFIILGVLSKIPAAYLLVLLVFPMLDKEVSLKQKTLLALITLLGLIPAIWWYFYWVPYLIKNFEPWPYFMGTSFSNGLHELITNPEQTLNKFYFEALKFTGFAAFLSGLGIAIYKKDKKIIFILLSCLFAFGLYMLKSGRNFYHHTYYVIPFVPVMCLVAAYGICQIKKVQLQCFVLIVISIEGIANQQHDFRIKNTELYKLQLESIADSLSSKNDLFAINGGINPQQLYLLHRRGFTEEPEKFSDVSYLEFLKQHHCKFVVINKHNNVPENMPASVGEPVYTDDNFVVYKLIKKLFKF